jgi:hypothetical protein
MSISARDHRTRLALLAIPAVLAACAGPTTVAKTLPASTHHNFAKIGRTYFCTVTGWALRAFPNHKSYPPNFPGAPPRTRRPATCFASPAQAARYGYPIASPPKGGVEIDGLYLVPTTKALRRSCRVAAHFVGFAVPCPGLLPSGFTGETVKNLCAHGAHPAPGTPGAVTRCVSPDVTSPRSQVLGDWTFYLNDMEIGVPPGYVGINIPGTSPAAHLVIEAGPTASEDYWGCGAQIEKITGSTVIRGVRMSIARCPPGSDLVSGHLMLTWSRRGVTYTVTLHGYSAANLAILKVLAAHLQLITS